MDFASLMGSMKGKFGGGMAPEAKGFAGAMANQGGASSASAGAPGLSGMQLGGGALSGFGQGMTTMDPAVHRAYEQGSGGYANMAHAERMKEILGGAHQAKVSAAQRIKQKYSEHFHDPEINKLEHGMSNDLTNVRGGAGTSPTSFDYKSLMAGGN